MPAKKPLSEYDDKRRFDRTPEPSGERGRETAAKRRKAKKLVFVVQQHRARRMHYDFRLEVGGVLASWAIPKGPSLNPGDRRLAVHVEDHPFDYRGFEGVIPEGDYGAGSVIVWDGGTWTPLETDDPAREAEIQPGRQEAARDLQPRQNARRALRRRRQLAAHQGSRRVRRSRLEDRGASRERQERPDAR